LVNKNKEIIIKLCTTKRTNLQNLKGLNLPSPGWNPVLGIRHSLKFGDIFG